MMLPELELQQILQQGDLKVTRWLLVLRVMLYDHVAEFIVMQVSLLAGPKQPNTMVAAILASAAAVPELTSLKLCVSGTKPLCITDSLLLPLTAAAGGPKKLETLHLAAGFGRTAGNDAIRGWCVLQHLKCLRNLSIRQLGDTILSFPRDSLPASVEVFGSKGFILVESPDVGDATEGDGSAVHMHC